MQPFIRVSQLKQSFGAQEVLKGVSFDVDKGELLALIGGSGAGKSVILKHLDGLIDPLDGYVDIDGRRISNVPEKVKREIRSKIGFMFQQGALFDSLSVGENVAFPLQEAGLKNEEELDSRISAALESVGLSGQEEKMPANLSGGMIKRVAVARAIVMTPECLLYDEPTAGLDPIVTDSISFLIRQICKDKGITTVIVSH
ncbi:ATP-binding cassette domain-containing protein, partial [uncultured Akkermansia sp.]